MSRLRVISYDLETTGFVPGKDKILEIGAVMFCPHSGEKKEFSVLVCVPSVSPIVSSLTGITTQTLKEEGCLPIGEAIRAFYDFAFGGEGRVLVVGHNILKFDNIFTNLALKAEGLPQIKEGNCWDTLAEMRKHLTRSAGRRKKKSQKVNLLAACRYYGVFAAEPRHRALADAKSSLNIYKAQRARSRTAPTLRTV